MFSTASDRRVAGEAPRAVPQRLRAFRTSAVIRRQSTGGHRCVRGELSSVEIDGKVRYEAGSYNAKLCYPVDEVDGLQVFTVFSNLPRMAELPRPPVQLFAPTE